MTIQNDLPEFGECKKKSSIKGLFPMALPDPEKYVDGERIMVCIYFVKKNNSLVIDGGFVKKSLGLSKTRKKKVEESKSLKSKEVGQIEI